MCSLPNLLMPSLLVLTIFRISIK
uniref:Uncharacterized protein n=1 Tax=Anguilla anguilla TaxID=7936 RepID=A0A0E9S5G0_ANGAN